MLQGIRTILLFVLATAMATSGAASLPVPVHSASDVDIVIMSEQETVAPDQVVNYRVMVRNNSSEDIANAQLIFHVPNFLVPLDATPQAQGDPATRTIEWTQQALSAGGVQTFTLDARVEAHAPPGTALAARTVFTGAGTQQQADNTVTITGAPAIAAGAPTGPAQLVLVVLGAGMLTGLAGLRYLV